MSRHHNTRGADAPLASTWRCGACGGQFFLGAHNPRKQTRLGFVCAKGCPAESKPAPARKGERLAVLTMPELPRRLGAHALTPAGGIDLSAVPAGADAALLDGRRIKVTRQAAPVNWRPAAPATT